MQANQGVGKLLAWALLPLVFFVAKAVGTLIGAVIFLLTGGN